MTPPRARRSSLRDRNAAAIAHDPTPEAPAVEPTAQTVETPQRAARPKATKSTAPAAGETARLGIYLTPAEFDDAKAGYLADWTNGGESDTFGKWIAAAIDTYAARTPRQRSSAPPKGRAEERTGSTRSFSIPADTVARMREAISADHQAGRWPSDSAWCGEAISYAVGQARSKNGGTLPTPPPRLPNRLVR
ncbi:hypothetical protein [Yimella sp. cx-51]|uniref:hypothetical protein n=1 Tax=Yimella sp. cx-51 TaxID=2770551 RepID=UPI00165DAF5F|nr:hypothetical protein [Yimella sp. cx-51]MBC9958366.1 hypothetical protein [Yimella sp. cx-51]QTH39749.1 hypothetical protein J5M86_15150 [Yimella sp. cx-51]